MGMRRLTLFAAVHGAGTALLVHATPALLAGAAAGDPGDALLLVAGWIAVAAGGRTTLSVVLAMLWRGLRAAGMRAEPLRAAAVRIAPRAVGTAIAAGAGGTVALGALAAPALAASPSPAWPLSPAASSPDPAWPLTAEPAVEDSATQAPPPAPDSDAPDARAGTGTEETHTVVEGDSLWAIAADRLPGAATAEIAAAVDALQKANRDLIGADANLILPGQRLVLP